MRFFFIILALVLACNMQAQNMKELEQKKKKNQKEINYFNKLLNETKKNSAKSLNNLVILNKKINLRKEVISNINSELGLLNIKIEKNKKEIAARTKELTGLKGEYAQMIVYAYKNRNSYERFMFLLSAADFNQAYQRLKYLQQYTEYRRNQAFAIIKNQKSLAKKLADLQTKINEKQELLLTQQEESGILEKEKGEQDEILQHLKSKESDLKKKLESQMRVAQQLNKSIESIIAAESESRKKANELAKKEKVDKQKGKSKFFGKPKDKNMKHETENTAENNTKPVKAANFDVTPEDQLVSNNFSYNKGKLPWPLEKGLITGFFGDHEHPVLKGIIVRNNGIDISTSEGEAARSVFAGEVTKVFNVPNGTRAIIIRHGTFYSVYSNLSVISVKEGEKVSAKQKLGSIFTDNDENKTELHFEIWKDNHRLDPSGWLSSKN